MGIRKALLDLLFPPKCCFCREFLSRGESKTCASCKDALPHCREGASIQAGEGHVFTVSAFYYDGLVRDSIHRYKFEGLRSYSAAYADFLAPAIACHLTGRYDILSWVPVSQKRLRTRGYDQAKLLAKATAPLLDTTAIETLQKVKDVKAQSGLGGPAERRANISGAYQAIDPEGIAGKRILLIDDVLTTGATLSECANCLLSAGAKEVLCATLARSSV